MERYAPVRGALACCSLLVLATVVAVSLSACATSAKPASSAAEDGGDSAETTVVVPPAFHPTSFTRPLTITNTWTPLTPGMQATFTGFVEEDDEKVAHSIVSIVTDLTKRVDGVTCRVVWDRDYNAGKLSESELLFVAQDDKGTVWLFGEFPALFSDGHYNGAPDTWISGYLGSAAGIFMPAEPKVGSAPFSQGYAPSVDFFDVGRVVAKGQKIGGKGWSYRDATVIEEWSPAAPDDGHQMKYYAPRTGLVFVAPKGGEAQEQLHLASKVKLTSAQLARIRAEALALEALAYDSNEAYGDTPTSRK